MEVTKGPQVALQSEELPVGKIVCGTVIEIFVSGNSYVTADMATEREKKMPSYQALKVQSGNYYLIGNSSVPIKVRAH
jgi:hypothetical protein